MNEAEIAALIENIITPILFSDDPGDWNYIKAAGEAAHAIAEKLKEGVVWEGEAHLYHHGQGASARTNVIVGDDGFRLSGHKGMEGEFVTVTVRKKEEKSGS